MIPVTLPDQAKWKTWRAQLAVKVGVAENATLAAQSPALPGNRAALIVPLVMFAAFVVSVVADGARPLI